MFTNEEDYRRLKFMIFGKLVLTYKIFLGELIMEKNLLEEIQYHLLNDEKPSIYLNEINKSFIDTPLQMLYELKDIEQNKEYHPEGSVWNHVMMVVDRAATLRHKANDAKCFMTAALLHDIGKKPTTRINKKGRIISYDHDKVGSQIVENVLSNYMVNDEEKKKIVNLVRFHMHHLYILKNLPYGSLDEMMESVDLNDMILIFISDRLGRGELVKDRKSEEIDDIKKIVNIIKEKYKVSIEEIDSIINEL